MDASAGVRRKDTTKGPPLRILSLDGGGIRGYSMLIILQELMHKTFVEIHGRAPRREEIPKPCDQFDLIVGTGTGGLIALMLGRLRMDIETSKDVYVRMTKRVFETDKTFAGIPYTSTLFKASKLEDAIRDCVREHTINEDEGNDENPEHDPTTPMSSMRPNDPRPQRSMSAASRYSQIGSGAQTDYRSQMAASRYGKPNAMLYDSRTRRAKTAVTAVYKGTRPSGGSVVLRSYDSRKESAIEPRCTVWQAGRATCATALAFKPIQIGQSTFLDEGAGKYNPAPQALDEAISNEWPGREVGVLVSVGTGKRPSGTDNQQHAWWEGFVGGGMGDFAEARRRLISKIEGCEQTHQWMKQKYLFDRNVDPANYYRLNVDVGVGEFGMNEWHRLAEISTNTRRYLSSPEVQGMNIDCAVKMSRIHRANLRFARATSGESYMPQRLSFEQIDEKPVTESKPPLVPNAIELPAEVVLHQQTHFSPSNTNNNNNDYGHSPQILLSPQTAQSGYTYLSSDDKFLAEKPSQYEATYRRSHEILRPDASLTYSGSVSMNHLPIRSSSEATRPMGFEQKPYSLAPPLPPKTPIQESMGSRLELSGSNTGSQNLPYPMSDGPPPVNLARKPELGR